MIDPSRITFHLLSRPKGAKGTRGATFNLHSVVGDDWTSSSVSRAHVHDGRLLLLGTVEKHQQIGALTTLVAEQACWWEYALPGV